MNNNVGWCPLCRSWGNVHDPDKHGVVFAETWCQSCERPADGPDGFCYQHRTTESQVIAGVARAEYANLDADAKAATDQRWNDLPEWRKQDLRDAIEFDLL